MQQVRPRFRHGKDRASFSSMEPPTQLHAHILSPIQKRVFEIAKLGRTIKLTENVEKK